MIIMYIMSCIIAFPDVLFGQFSFARQYHVHTDFLFQSLGYFFVS